MTTDLRDLLDERLGAVVPPSADPGRARREGRRLRRRRRAATLGGTAALVAGAVALGSWVAGPDGPGAGRGLDPVGRLDYSQGLRGYADPGGEVHLGGRTFPGGRLGDLDTDGAATPYGILYYADGVPFLLREDGASEPLEEDAEPSSFVPTAKADSVGPLVAYGATLEGRRTVLVRDLARGEQVATLDVHDRDDVVVDALDDGVVVLRDRGGSTAWDTATGEEAALAGPDTRVADLRGGVLLHDGPAPDGPAAAGYRLVAGAVDARLTFDGGHVLDWSSRLAPTTPDGRPVVLERGPTKQHALGFWTIDTDGSVLVAALDGTYPHYLVHDCEVPSGRCTELGPLVPTSGDPVFVGADM